jgi:plasmid maintenance system antidote protein VapI
MIPENRMPTHPGEILLEEFLKPMNLTQVLFAQHVGVPTQRTTKLSMASAASHRKRPGFLHRPLAPHPSFD